MIPKKIYLNYVHEDDEEKTWSVDPVYVEDCEMQNREYTDLSQAWHDAKEEPEEGTKVVVIDNNGWTGSGLFNPRAMVKGVYIYGDLVVDWYSVVRWAYIEDLLPKKE